MSQVTAGLSIGQVAERTGLSVHALRFYEREGILADPVRRESNGRRVYSEDDVEWLNMCIKFRSSGMPLDTIRRYTDLVRQGPGNEQDRLALLRSHQESVTAQIQELTECLNVISHKVEVYQEHLDRGTAECLWVAPSTLPQTSADEAGQAVRSQAGQAG
ncbi:DNA-binding transcriptional MerR regulator [Kribbella orskensis]|uniref:DNA-binding transcriptional MerR regulator n=1 Tax=Kribbella orskensis TaxID=2512216 RepID=A0ABY2BMJ1_9ACTN|nr:MULTISPECIES: MerR family transcriptional regulator [Kribbella]TCN41085.1 DNA-binding transcriptional MerR regulator [Kribbella sp. VKM Ac-2500]TCO24337.1 DNA-binding transcriptional MerR regulator [Kribbella orskensis]